MDPYDPVRDKFELIIWAQMKTSRGQVAYWDSIDTKEAKDARDRLTADTDDGPRYLNWLDGFFSGLMSMSDNKEKQ